jgi:hypothetical protein
MSKCYLCAELITEENKSREHIIPNCIGGRLTSFNILCKSCNTGFSIYDAEFCKLGSVLATAFGIKKQRGHLLTHKAIKESDGTEQIMHKEGDTLWAGHLNPVHSQDGQSLSFDVFGVKRARQEMERLKKELEGKGFQIHDITFTRNYKEDDIDSYIVPCDYDVPSLLRGVCKILVGFYYEKTGDLDQVSSIIEFLKVGDENYFSRESKLQIPRGDNPCHTIIVWGSKEERILYGYFEMFNEVGYEVLMNSEYEGENLAFNYRYDLKTEKPIEFDLKLWVDKAELIAFIIDSMDLASLPESILDLPEARPIK